MRWDTHAPDNCHDVEEATLYQQLQNHRMIEPCSLSLPVPPEGTENSGEPLSPKPRRF